MKAAAAFLRTHRDLIPSDLASTTATQLAVMAFAVHELFVAESLDGALTITSPLMDELNASLERRRIR